MIKCAVSGNNDTIRTFITSKGCVANVAIAPAEAAEMLCIMVEWAADVDGTIMA